MTTQPVRATPARGTLMGYPSKTPPEGLTLAPDLAEAHPAVSKDGRTYTFTVRKDARFSTGASVTARAFSRAIERILDPAMEATLAQTLADLIAKVTASDRKLTIRLTRREPELPETMALVCAVAPNCLPIRRVCELRCQARRRTTSPSTSPTSGSCSSV